MSNTICYCGKNHEMSFDQAVDVLAGTPDRVDARMVGSENVRSGPSETLSARIGALGEAEIVFSMYLRLLLVEPVPDLPPFDEARWEGELDYADRDLEMAARSFRVLRSGNIAILRTVDPLRRLREGWLSEYGTVTLEAVTIHAAARDVDVLAQIDSVSDWTGGNLAAH